MTAIEIMNERPESGGYKVDMSRGGHDGRVSSEWFSRPDDEKYLSLSDLYASVQGRAERSKTRTVESAAIRVEANRDDPEKLALVLPDAEAPIAPTHWSFGQLASLVGAPAAYLRQLPAPLAGINLQYGLTNHRAEQVKTMEVANGRTELRAVTGPDYGRIYDHELVSAVQRIAGDGVGDTRWNRRIHVLVKPTRPDLVTNLVINTDRRTYHLELRATPQAYMASVSWQYPEDELIALRRQNDRAEASLPIGRNVDLDDLNFRYRITGDRAPWRPRRAFDDGRQVFIEFPRGIGQGEMPPLFVIGPEGDGQLVNYRIRRNYMIVDRLFAAAELRLGDRQRVVRIVRTDGVRRSAQREERVVSAWRQDDDR